MKRICAAAAAALSIAACGGDAPPAQQASQSLASAREDIDKARAAIQATEQQSRALQERIQAQRAELDNLVQKRLALLRQLLSEDEARLQQLPAPREAELRPRLQALGKDLEAVSARLQAYRDAPPEKAAEALAALEQALAGFAERRRELEGALQPA